MNTLIVVKMIFLYIKPMSPLSAHEINGSSAQDALMSDWRGFNAQVN